ncbi:ATP-binding protein [Streptomyces sp. NPDC058662]|uniref:ATP-binding protein n=1 Tax=Streptomyces sp. NPDC058662 TaxID=3346583 RepID=UPI003663C964
MGPPPPSHHRELTFPPGDASAYAAGIGFTRRALADWHLTAAAESGGAVLVTAELLANAVQHAGGPVSLSLDHHAGHLLISVTDRSLLPPHMPDHRADSIGGHGLFIVDRTAHDWGSWCSPTDKTVWADLALPPESGPDR